MNFAIQKKIVLLFLTVLLASGSVSAQIRWLWDFEGILGDEKIGFTLGSNEIGKFQRAEDLECSYFYVKDLKDIRLRCSLTQDGDLTVQEVGGDGKVAATFKGKFLENKIDDIEGIWIKAGDTKSLPFKLNLARGTGGALNSRYSAIEAPDDAEFERQVQDFRNAVLKADKEKVVSFIEFPIKVQVGKKGVNIRNKAAFFRNYDKIFYKDFVEKIRETVPHNLFHRDIGAMLGSGLIWFWGDGKVIAINN
jgi:hypothetical protein